MKLFVDQNETFDVIFFVGERDGKIFVKDKKEEGLEEIKIVFCKPNYGDNVQIFSSALKLTENGLQLDPSLVRFERFCVLVKSWDIKDEKGNLILLNRENIKKLNPDIAGYIISELDKKLENA